VSDTPRENAAAIRAILKHPNIETFVQRYAQNVSKHGVFFKTAKPKPVGTTIKFELKLADGTKVLRGVGEVSWIRATETAGAPPGMGIRFQKLDANSRDIVKRILTYKKEHSLPGPSRFSVAPSAEATQTSVASSHDKEMKRAEEEAKQRAEEEAKQRAEEEAKRAEEEARRAEEEAKQRAEEEAKRRAEEEARRAEEEAKQRAEEEAIRKRRIQEKLRAEQRSGAKIEADENEIDELVAAFDTIQIPSNSDEAAPRTAPVKIPEEDESDTSDISEALDTNMAESKLDDALFAEAQHSEASQDRSIIADLLESTEDDESQASEFDDENQFGAGSSEEPFSDSASSDDSNDKPAFGLLSPELDSDDHPDALSATGDLFSPDAEPLDLGEPLATVAAKADPFEAQAEEDEFDDDVEELSIADMLPEEPYAFDNGHVRSAALPRDAYDVSDEPPLFSADARPSRQPYEAEEYDIEEIDDLDFIEEIDDLEEVESVSGVDEMGINFNGLSRPQNPSTPPAPSDTFDSLVNQYTRETRQPSAPPPPLLHNQAVDNALNTIFSGASSPQTSPAPSSRISHAPETLPDDALPQHLANFIERKSQLPGAPQQARVSTFNAPSAPLPPQSVPPQAPQTEAFLPAVSLNQGMPGQQNPWGSDSWGPLPAEPQQVPPVENQEQPSWSNNPNQGMPGQQSAWPEGQNADIDLDDDERKKGFFGKLFGK
jgi:uncharacterized protein (TIGR02266 family)